jgi:amino acid adenylation domain-containing protein
MTQTPADADLANRLARLSPEQRALLQRKLTERREAAMAAPDSAPAQQAPLAFAQLRFWFLHLLEPDQPAYNEWNAVRLRGPLDQGALARAIDALVQRHDALRTRVALRDEAPVQVIGPPAAGLLAVVDLAGLPAAAGAAEADRRLAAEAARPFDIEQGPLFRALLCRLSADEHILLLVFHHLIIDAWSAAVLYRELGALYRAHLHGEPAALPALPVQYADFARRQRDWLRGDAYARALSYWRRQLADCVPLQLPTDRPRPPKQTFSGAREPIALPAALVAALAALGRGTGASLFMVLLAALKTLLHRHGGQEDLVVGAPVAARTQRDLEGLIGCFTNTLALRTDCAGDPSFRTLLGRVRGTVLDALEHQDLPFEKLVEELQPDRDLSGTPLFNVLFVHNNTALDVDLFDGLETEPAAVDVTIARFDLTFSVQELPGRVDAYVDYNTDLFDAATIRRMAGHLQNLLAAVAEDPDRPLSALPLLGEAERRQLLLDWNATATDADTERCIHALIEAQAERTPDAVAVVFDRERLTYRELDERANRLAHHLRGLGVAPEAAVALCLERSADMLVGLLGILKAGGAYVPIDPEYPPERIGVMLEDGAPRVLLTQSSLLEVLPDTAARVVCLDQAWPAIAACPATRPDSGVGASNLAYVLYTSGSTGRPKGVEIEHHSAVALIEWSRRIYDDADIAGVFASTSICFDLSVFELFMPLARGGTVILGRNALHLASLPAAAEVTLINTVPSAMTELVRNAAVPAGVRVVNLAGEPLKNALVQQIYRETGVARVLNLYGPSEDTTYSTFEEIARGATAEPTIGRSIADTRAYILDGRRQPVPVGVIGELYLGGEGVARGYRNQPALTAERFIDSPFPRPPGAERGRPERLYATGDLARRLADGRIDFLGRRDHQVKLRGFRIELGEIEAVLARHPDVDEAAVVVREDRPGDRRLVAYVAGGAGLDGDLDATLRAALRRALPAYMVPAAFVRLDALPLTPNGKLDRGALPAPEAPRTDAGAGGAAPAGPVEEAVAAIWREVLGLDRVGSRDDFFALGGHSLLATQVISRCRNAFGLELPLLALFEERTVAGLAARVEQLRLARTLQQELSGGDGAREEIRL